MKRSWMALVLVFLLTAAGVRMAGAASLDPADIGEAVFNGLFNGHGVIPFCEDHRVRGKIMRRFRRYTAPNVLEQPLAIEDIGHVREAAFDIANPSPLARRYCQARAYFNDARYRSLFYFIEESTGFVGIKWNVEFCIAGMDPWKIYDGRCRVARPQQRW